MSCWEILQIPSTSTPEEVKRAYRKIAEECHPDKGGSPDVFIRLNIAYRAALDEAEQPLVCPQCGGLGRVRHAVNWSHIYLNCPYCSGNGTIKRT